MVQTFNTSAPLTITKRKVGVWLKGILLFNATQHWKRKQNINISLLKDDVMYPFARVKKMQTKQCGQHKMKLGWLIMKFIKCLLKIKYNLYDHNLIGNK